MSDQKIQELLKFYAEHTDQEFVKKILEALRAGELTENELVEIGNWIAKHSKRREKGGVQHES
jgi:hypothetical protein